MKKITQDSIINIDDNTFDSKLLFNIPIESKCEFEKDMSELLLQSKNDNLNYKKDYKLWSEVYSPKEELRIFEEIFEDAIKNNKKIHISNVSLSEEIDLVKKLYTDLGYFNTTLNCFQVDFENSPITIGVNINNIIYSFKDYKQLKEKILFVPPPREPRHQKAIKSALNSGVISTIGLNHTKDDIIHIGSIIKEEKASLTRLASTLFYNYISIGFVVVSGEMTVSIK